MMITSREKIIAERARAVPHAHPGIPWHAAENPTTHPTGNPTLRRTRGALARQRRTRLCVEPALHIFRPVPDCGPDLQKFWASSEESPSANTGHAHVEKRGESLFVNQS